MKLYQIAFPLLAMTAFAAAQEARYSVVVSYSDLNLRSQSGLNALDGRLERAVRKVCGEHDGSVVPEHRFAVQQCLSQKRAEVAALRDRAIAGYASPQTLASR